MTASDRGPRDRGRATTRRPAASGAEVVSFEDSFDAEARETFGDLGPATADSGGGRGGERRGGDRGRRGGGRR